MDKLLIIVPAHNEATTIFDVVSSLKQLGFQVLVVDDASDDETVDIAVDAGAMVLRLVSKLGAWSAIQAGLRYAHRNKYDLALSMDADGQHIPSSIPAFLAFHKKSNVDVSIGEFIERASLMRKLAWALFRGISRLTVADLTSGLRIYNERAIELLSSEAASLFDYQDVGVLILLNNSGLKIGEVPVEMEQRQDGKSRIFSSWMHVLQYMLHTLILSLIKFELPERSVNAN